MPPPPYNFARGHPNRDLIPVDEMKALMNQVGSSPSSSDEQALRNALNYGDEDGQADFRQELEAFLHRQCAFDQGPDATTHTTTNSLFITGGVSHGIELLCSVATRPGDVVWVEEPTYFLAANIFKAHGLHVESLPMKHAGVVDMDALEKQLTGDNGCDPPRIIYIIPTHQNPTGRTMSLEDRMRLARFAEEYSILVIADEVYHLLDYKDGTPRQQPVRMAMLNRTQATAVNEKSSKVPNTSRSLLSGCCSVSSFTKIFCPGVRVGWIEGPAPIIDALKDYGYIVSQGGVAPFMGHVFCRALQQRVCDNVLSNLCVAYTHRVDLLVNIVKNEPRISIPCRPTGGYFLWLILPFEAAPFLDYCEPEVTFLPGTKCIGGEASRKEPSNLGQGDNKLSQSIRLCFAYLDIADLEAGAALFLSKFRSYVTDCEQAQETKVCNG